MVDVLNTLDKHTDQRWDTYYNLGSGGRLELKKLTLSINYTIDVWLKLKYYPVVSLKKNKMHRPQIFEFGKLKCKYDDKLLSFVDKEVTTTQIEYPENKWFHLVIAAGESDTVGVTPGKIYIDGKLQDKSVDLPKLMNYLEIGIYIGKNQKHLSNPIYIDDNCLGDVKIYDRTLDEHEIDSNYRSLSLLYGHSLAVTKVNPIKTGLIFQLIKNDKKNVNTDYSMSNSDLRELSKMIGKIYGQLGEENTPGRKYSISCGKPKHISSVSAEEHVRAPHAEEECSRPPIAPGPRSEDEHIRDLILGETETKPKPKKLVKVEQNVKLINKNPEYFIKVIKNPKYNSDKATKALILNDNGVDGSVQQNVDGIFDNVLKTKVLIAYLKTNPKHFVRLLKSNQLNNEQLAHLHSILKLENVKEGFVDYNENYVKAMGMLEKTLSSDQFRPKPLHISTTDGLEKSAHTIATVMKEKHNQDKLDRRLLKEQKLLSKINVLNHAVLHNQIRNKKLSKLLARQKQMLGLIINESMGKCIAAIDMNGQLRKICPRKTEEEEALTLTPKLESASVSASESELVMEESTSSSLPHPYKIIMNRKNYQVNVANILRQQRLHNLTITQLVIEAKNDEHMVVLGQCINKNTKTIGAIIRYAEENHYIPTVETEPDGKLPIIAMIDANQQESIHNANAKCASGSSKCLPGYGSVSVDEKVGDEYWLNDMEGETAIDDEEEYEIPDEYDSKGQKYTQMELDDVVALDDEF